MFGEMLKKNAGQKKTKIFTSDILYKSMSHCAGRGYKPKKVQIQLPKRSLTIVILATNTFDKTGFNSESLDTLFVFEIFRVLTPPSAL